MSTLELGALILAGEFALIAWGILFLMLRRRREQQHADHAHADTVMQHIETQEVSRRDAVASLFEQTYHLAGEELTSKVDEYVAREKAFYNAMLSLYLNRDGAKLQQIPEELAKVLAPWASITPSGMIHASEVGGLEQEKTQLAAELESTNQTLEQLMDEYMAAFKRDQPKPDEAPPAPPSSPEPSAEEAQPVASQELDAGDSDIQSEDAPTQTPAAPDEDAIDQATLDAMFDSFGSAADEAQPAPSSDNDAPSAGETASLAREELDGLADLFGDPDEKK